MFSLPQIRTLPDPILEQPTTAVQGIMWDQLPAVERDLRAAMQTHPAVGFAANQLGYDFRVFIMVRADDSYLVLVNPKVIMTSHQTMEDWEGCMSIPDKKALVDRALSTIVTFETGRKGRRKTLKFQDYEARIVQHEMDHLNGITILDRALEVKDIDRELA